MLQRDIAAGDCCRARDVEWPFAGRGGPREIEPHAFAADRQVERDAERLIGDAIVVEIVVEGVGAVRATRRFGSHQGFGARRKGFERPYGVVTVFVEQRMQTAFAEVERINLAVEIAAIGLRVARVRGQNVDDVLLDHAVANSFTGGMRTPSG